MPWPVPESDDELLRLAKGYPYSTPGRSYLYNSEAITPLDAANPHDFDGRMPVIAHGSNRSPQRLIEMMLSGATMDPIPLPCTGWVMINILQPRGFVPTAIPIWPRGLSWDIKSSAPNTTADLI